MLRLTGFAVLGWAVLFPALVDGRLAGQSDDPRPARFTIIVNNQAFQDVKVYSAHLGTPIRLGTVRARSVAHLPARCDDFRGAETDFVLRPIAGRSFRLEGESIGSCDRDIRIDVLPIGVEFSRVWVLPRDGDARDGP